MKKLTLEHVKSQAQKIHPGLDFSEFSYGGLAVKGTVICPSHGPFLSSWGTLQQGCGCPACGFNSRVAKRTMPLEEWKAMATSRHRGFYDYSQVVWKGSQHKVEIVCPTHGPFWQHASRHSAGGQGCRLCSDAASGSRRRLSQEDFISRVKAVHGDKYDLSKAVYAGMAIKVEILCPEHGPFFPTPGNLIGNQSGCPACGNAIVGLKSRRSEQSYFDEFSKIFNSRYTYTEITYDKGSARVHATCPEHGEFSMTVSDHLGGHRCSKCFGIQDQQSFIAKATKLHGGKYDYSSSKYTKSLEKVEIICPHGHHFWQTPAMHVFGTGQGCPLCARVGPSKGQLEVQEFLGAFTKVIPEHTLQGRKRMDIYLPEHSLGVEYHGLIWHSTKFQKDRLEIHKRHLIASSLGIRLIHIYEDEWRDKPEVVKSLLLSAIGHGVKLHGRKCHVLSVPPDVAAAFLDVNHIQGRIHHSILVDYLGLMFQGKLVACMGFSRKTSQRGSRIQDGTWELRRYATSALVRGGASKLLSSFLKLHPDAVEVVSYSDNRLFTGAMYRSLGFTLEALLPPSYGYVSPGSKVRHSKSRFQRKNLEALFGISFNPEMSESENCKNNGWYQIFDCGKSKWRLSVC